MRSVHGSRKTFGKIIVSQILFFYRKRKRPRLSIRRLQPLWLFCKKQTHRTSASPPEKCGKQRCEIQQKCEGVAGE